MATTIRRWTVPAEGEGRPDYTGEQFRSAGFFQYNLQYGETLRIFVRVFSTVLSPFIPFVTPPLAVGATMSLIDATTGIPMPATIPQGHAWRFLSDVWSFNQLSQARLYLDLQLVGENYGRAPGTFYEARLAPIDTALFDPTGASAHLWDSTLTNIGVAVLSGSWGQYIVQYPLGTMPPPKTKTVKCKHCGALTGNVPKRATKVKCSKCGKETWYYAVVDWENQNAKIRL